MKFLFLSAACLGLLTLGACTQQKKQTPRAEFIYKDIDSTVNPADDFFKFANGRWLKENPIPSSERAWGISKLVQDETYKQLLKVCEDAAKDKKAAKGSASQKIGDFYSSAMDTNTIEKLGAQPVLEDFKRIDGMKDKKQLLDVIAFYQTYNVGPMFSSYVSQDEKNSSRYALHLTQGGISLPDRDYYFNNDVRTKSIRDEFVKHISKMFELTGLDKSSADKNSAIVMNIETGLAKASRKLEDLRDPYANYNKMTVAGLSKLAPSLNWTDLLKKMEVKNFDSLIVGQPEFYKQLEQSFKSVSLDDWKVYLKWHVLDATADMLSSAIDKENFHFEGTILSGVKEQRPRWKRSLDAEEGAMGDLLGQLYVSKYYSPKTKQRYENLVNNMLEVYAERIKRLDWMSEPTKQKALVKLSKVMKKVGYPDKWKDYSALEIVPNSYYANGKNAAQWSYRYYVNKLGQPVDRTEWGMTPQTYNAYYNPSNNEIVLPAAAFILPALADSIADDAIVYAYAGASTIGHEITHGFDDEGRQFDADGNLSSWWTKEDEQKFNAKAKLMVDQFSSYVVLDSLHVNGKACLGENIADLGGLAIGYEAFKRTKEGQKDTLIDGLTPDQRFFLGYAYSWLGQQRDASLAKQIMTDVHAPGFLRVNGPMSNMPEFYKAFNVKPGNKMYRPDSLRVKIW